MRWAIESGFKPTIYGTRWSDLVPENLIKGENIDNKALSRAYAAAKVVLNDHWESMREYGFVSNRIFDVLASGGRLISDAMPSIGHVFGSAVTQVRGPEELQVALDAALSAGASSASASDDLERIASQVLAHHSFDARAVKMINDISAYLGLPILFRMRVHRTLRRSPRPPLRGENLYASARSYAGRRITRRALLIFVFARR